MFAYLQVLNPIICLGINAFFHVTSFRFISKLGMLKSIIIGFLLGLLGLFLLEYYIFIKVEIAKITFLYNLTTNLIIYSALGYCYFHFVNLGETARRIRILREIHESKDGLTMTEILKHYNAKEIVEKRLARLLSNGQVVYKDDKYYIGKYTVLLIAKIITMLKLIIFGKITDLTYSGFK